MWKNKIAAGDAIEIEENPKTKSIFSGFLTKSVSEVMVCQNIGATVHGVHIKRTRLGLDTRTFTISTEKDVSGIMKKKGRKCSILVLLDKSKYMLKTLELPKVASEQVDTMLHLEVEALLPPDYGPVEISYLLLSCKKEGYQRYQVCICRRDILMQDMETYVGLGIDVDFFLPSFFSWKVIFDYLDIEIDLCVNVTDAGRMEIAVNKKTDGPLIREIRIPQIECNSRGFEQGLIDCLRPLISQAGPESLPVKVGWIGQGCPHHMSNGRIVLKPIDAGQGIPVEVNEIKQHPFLGLAAVAMLALRHFRIIQAGNMLPRNVVIRQQQKTMFRRLVITAVSFLLALVLVLTALKITVIRYQKSSIELSGKIALIQKEGRAVGRRIEQLKAIRAAQVTRNDFKSILEGLYEATPNGMTYSHVELNDAGKVRLRGQAKSLSLPFLAPEQLEKQPIFEQVLLNDAGQSKRERGSITEFRIDCEMRRQEKP